MVGRGWKRLRWLGKTKTSLTGATSNMVSSRGYRTCSAASVATVGGEDHLIIVHWALWAGDDENQVESLINQNHVRMNDVVVDDNPVFFKGVDGKPGTQQLWKVGDDGMKQSIPLCFDGSAMFLPLREPTEEEMKSMTPFVLTPEEEWSPEELIKRMRRNKPAPLAPWKDRLANQADSIVEETLKRNTCFVKDVEVETSLHPHRHLKSRYPGLKWGRLNDEVATDTGFSSVKCRHGCNCFQIFAAKNSGFTETMEMKKESNGPEALADFIREHGAPHTIFSDNAKMIGGKRWKKVLRGAYIKSRFSEPHCQNQNPAERRIGHVKSLTILNLRKYRANLRYWCDCMRWVKDCINFSAMKSKGYQVPIEMKTGETADLSMFRYHFWQPIHYYEPNAPFPEPNLLPGRWLGIAWDTGDRLTYRIKTEGRDRRNDQVITRSVIRPRFEDQEAERWDEDDMPKFSMYKDGKLVEVPDWDDDLREQEEIELVADATPSEETPSATSATGDNNLEEPRAVAEEPAEPISGNPNESAAAPTTNPQDTPEDDDDAPGLHPRPRPVTQDSDSDWDSDDDSEDDDVPFRNDGRTPPSPILETHLHPHLKVDPTIVTQDDDAPAEDMLDDLANHFDRDTDVDELHGIEAHSWADGELSFELSWMNGHRQWYPFEVVKADHPEAIANYILNENVEPRGGKHSRWARRFLRELKKAVRRLRRLHHNPQDAMEETMNDPGEEFSLNLSEYFMRPTRKTNRVHTQSAKKFYQGKRRRVTKHHKPRTKPGRNNRQMGQLKYGVEVPWNVMSALKIDAENGNTLWRDAIAKEMAGLINADCFRFQKRGWKPPDDYQFVPLRIVFDVKAETLRRKARLVCGGHVTKADGVNINATTVDPLSVRLLHVIAHRFGHKIVCGDIGQAFIQALTSEKIYCRCGPEFGKYAGLLAIVHRALYGLKGSANAFRAHLADVLRNHPELGFTQTFCDRDVWLKLRADGSGYDYICTHVDDFKIVAMDPTPYMTALESVYTITGDGAPSYYLGMDFERSPDHGDAWTQGSHTYLNESLIKIEKQFGTLKLERSPLPTDDHPEDDQSAPLNLQGIRQYQMLTGILQWLVQLGRIDIVKATNSLNQFNSSPREGHLRRVLRVFGFLKKYRRRKILIDSGDVFVSPLAEPPLEADFIAEYPDANKGAELDPRLPTPKGAEIQMTCMFDSSHADCHVTRRSTTGVLIFAGRTPIRWISKRQSTVEASTYGAEFSAMRTAVEETRNIRYYLLSFGIRVDSPTTLWGDNLGVIQNASIPDSAIKKKSVAISYHMVRECAAAGVILPRWLRSEDNHSDMLTKNLASTTLTYHTLDLMVGK